jgi:hypothetical protein
VASGESALAAEESQVSSARLKAIEDAKVNCPCPEEGGKLATSPWPANRGFLEGTVERKFLMPGDMFDRYGFGGGKFASPTGTPFEMRSLRPGSESLPYNNYRVIKPFEVNSGCVAPAFNKPGLGTQYELPVSIDTLLKRGIIEKVP